MQKLRFASKDIIKLQYPFSCLIVGASQSGKTTFMKNLLANLDELVNVPIDKVIYCYSIELPEVFSFLRQKLGSKFEVSEGFISISDFGISESGNTDRIIIVLDDLMQNVVKSVQISNLFTQGVHNNYLSVFVITQNIFQKGNVSRSISLNSSYIVFFNNPRDREQLFTLGRQVYGAKDGDRIIKEITGDWFDSEAYRYIFFDFKQKTHSALRIRVNILSDEKPKYIYRVKNG